MSQKSSSPEQHRKLAEQEGTISVGVVTVSDTRTPDTDENGQYLREQLASSMHELTYYSIIKDEADQVEEALEEAITKARIVIFNGGTGIAPRDRTYDVLDRMLQKRLPGFGELFRMLSYDQVGAAAILSRATAGVYKNTVVISTPGSNAAVRLAWEKLIEPELQHLAWEVIR